MTMIDLNQVVLWIQNKFYQISLYVLHCKSIFKEKIKFQKIFEKYYLALNIMKHYKTVRH